MPTIKNSDIIFKRSECFSPKATLLCGQVFRYSKIPLRGGVAPEVTGWSISSGDKTAEISEDDRRVVISAESPADAEYFWNYFDCGTDYCALSEKISSLPLMEDAVKNAYGLRLLKQQPYETLVSFIISANNHIPRIKATIERLCENVSRETFVSHGFPTAEEMAKKPAEFYKEIGCGYRDEYLAKTAKMAAEIDLESWRGLETEELLERLQGFPGVGPKVADCIALFAYQKYDVFPVDTWVKKIYFDMFGRADTPKNIRKTLTDLYGEYAGLAQQYLFYAKRGDR